MQRTLRTAHLVVGAITVGAFLVTGLVMYGHEPSLSTLDWSERLLFRSRYIYILAAGLVNLSLGIRYALPEGATRRSAAMTGSLFVLLSCVLLFFAFFAEPMAGRAPGPFSRLGLYALFGGVLLNVAASLRRGSQGTTQ
jgi:hypothetical protein